MSRKKANEKTPIVHRNSRKRKYGETVKEKEARPL